MVSITVLKPLGVFSMLVAFAVAIPEHPDIRYPNNIVPSSVADNTDAACFHLYGPWLTREEYSRPQRSNIPTEERKPLILSLNALTETWTGRIEFLCGDTRATTTLATQNARPDAIQQVYRAGPFRLQCAEDETPETFGAKKSAAHSGPNARNVRRVGICRAKQRNKKPPERTTEVKAGTSDCAELGLDARDFFSSVNSWLESVDGVTGAETWMSEYAAWFSIYQIDSYGASSSEYVRLEDANFLSLPVMAGRSSIFRACANRAAGLSNVILHIAAA